MDLKSLESAITDVTPDTFLSVVQADNLRDWRGLIIHHSYHPDKPVWGKDYARSINNYHKFAHNYTNGLGHQFVVSWNPANPKDVRIQCSYRWVKQLVGAHTVGRKKDGPSCDSTPNEAMIGICFIGNFDVFPVPPELCVQTKLFTDVLLSKLRIPREAVYGHFQWDFRTCPGRKMDLSFFRR